MSVDVRVVREARGGYAFEGTLTPPVGNGMFLVVIGNARALTGPGEQGYIHGAAFRSPPVEQGLCTLFVRGEDTDWGRALLVVGSDDEACRHAVIALPKLSREALVRGRVVDAAGAAVVGAEITYPEVEWGAYDLTSDALWRSTTDESGRFAFYLTKEKAPLTIIRGGFSEILRTASRGEELTIVLERE